MKRIITLFGLLLLLLADAAFAQTPFTGTLYQCPTLSLEGQRANVGNECPAWVWSAPRTDYLIATCGNATCSWNSSVTWRRVSTVPATAAISACTGTANGKTCSREAWVPKSSPFPATTPVVNCVLSEWELSTFGPWGACVAPGTQTRSEVWVKRILTPASGGGTACPSPLPTEPRTGTQACTGEPVEMGTIQFTRPDGTPFPNHRILTRETVRVSWSTQNADICTANWEVAPDGGYAQVPTSGFKDVRINVPTQNVSYHLNCRNEWSNKGIRHGYNVLSRAPKCHAHMDDLIAGRIAWDTVKTPNTGWDIKEVHFCPGETPQDPPIKYAYLLTWEQLKERAANEYKGILYDEVELANACDAGLCITLEPGPAKDELDAYYRLITIADVSGVVQ